MVLSDKDIKAAIAEGTIKINPLSMDNIQGASIDLGLGDEVYTIKKDCPVKPFEDLSKYYEKHSLRDKPFILEPGVFALASTKEYVSLPNDLIGYVETRSSFARMGLTVSLSSYVNPGYEGNLPLAIKNFGNLKIQLVAGMRICQLVLHKASSPVEKSYSTQVDAKYYQETGVTSAKLYLDKEIKEFLALNGITKLNNSDISELQKWLLGKIEDSSESIFKQLKDKVKL